MKQFIAAVFAAALSCGLYAAALPDGWRPYLAGSPDAKAKCSVTAAGDGVRIVDGSNAAEAGVSRSIPCEPGKYYRLTVRYSAKEALRNVEMTAYYPGNRRGGQAPVPAVGTAAVITAGPVPDGVKNVTIFFYSQRNATNTVTVHSAKLEVSEKPFDAPAAIAVVENREVWVAPDGSDANDGSKAKPWKTLEKASQVGPGTTVIFKPGRYPGKLAPFRSGAPDAPIVFRSAEPGKAVFTAGKKDYAVVIKGRQNIELDGFRFDVAPESRWLLVQDSRFCTVRNCHMEHSTVTNPIKCQNAHYCRFDRLKVFRCEARGRDGQVHGDMWNNYNVSHTVYSRLYIGRCGHRPMGLGADCRRIVVRDSVFDCRWGRNFEFFTPKSILVERCVVTNSYEGSGSFDGRAKLFTIDGIFRYNLLVRNNTCPLIINAYRYQDHPKFGMRRSRLYFNTWYYNQDCAWQMVGMWNRGDGPFMVADNIVKNNVMVDNNPSDGTALNIRRNIAPDNLFINNLLRGRKPGDTVVKSPAWPEPSYQLTAAEANAKLPKQYRRNFDADPKFEDVDRDDYRLKADSPAVDRGEALTVTTEASKGIYLSVADPRYFYDGFGIPGERGDTIMIGPEKKTARIVRVLAEDKMLILDRPVAVNKGDTVDLPYAGKAPDLGCYESGMKTGPEVDLAPYRIEKMDTATKPVIVCDFEENDVGSWFFYWNHTRKANSSAALDKTGGANGSKGSWKVYFRKNEYGKKTTGSLLSTHVVPSRWMIDRFPFVKFSYRIPKGVPVGVSIHEASMIGRASESPTLFLAGSPALVTKTKNNDYRREKIVLTDDGEWHTVTLDARAIRKHFPNVKMISLIRFWAPACNGKEGDAYWIDDFAILPADK